VFGNPRWHKFVCFVCEKWPVMFESDDLSQEYFLETIVIKFGK